MNIQYLSENIDTMFNLSLEIEGLLSLIKRREDFVAPEVYDLLIDKCKSLYEGVADTKVSSIEPKQDEIESQQTTSEDKEEEFLKQHPSLPGIFEEKEVPQETAAIVEDTILEEPVAEVVIAEETVCQATVQQEETPLQIAAVAEATVEYNSIPYEETLPIDAQPQESPKQEENNIASASLFEEEMDADIAPAQSKPQPKPVTNTTSQANTLQLPFQSLFPNEPVRRVGELRKQFTINDKFRFRRELFGNSDTEFTDALNLVEAMNSYEEAQDYFLNDLGWDSEQPEVQEFLAVIANYFA